MSRDVLVTATGDDRPRTCVRVAAVLALNATVLAALTTTALAQGRQTGTLRGTVLDAQRLVWVTIYVTNHSEGALALDWDEMGARYARLHRPRVFLDT